MRGMDYFEDASQLALDWDHAVLYDSLFVNIGSSGLVCPVR